VGINTHRSSGTGVAINNEMILTCAHVCHMANDFKQPLHKIFQVIKDTNLGKTMQIATLVAIDDSKDLAVLKCLNISNFAQFNKVLPNAGIHVGSLGYPNNSFIPSASQNIFTKRFKGSFVSTYNNQKEIVYTDQEMYPGTSGCPVFDVEGLVVGIHNRNENDPKNNDVRIDIAYNVSFDLIEPFLNSNNITFSKK